MSHLILFERPRQTLLVSMFVVALFLSVVLFSPSGAAEKTGKSQTIPGAIVSANRARRVQMILRSRYPEQPPDLFPALIQLDQAAITQR